jgi:hypothetical protein
MRKNSLQTGWYIYIWVYYIIYIYISESLAFFLVSKPRKKRNKCWNGDVSRQSCWVPMPTRGHFWSFYSESVSNFDAFHLGVIWYMNFEC